MSGVAIMIMLSTLRVSAVHRVRIVLMLNVRPAVARTMVLVCGVIVRHGYMGASSSFGAAWGGVLTNMR